MGIERCVDLGMEVALQAWSEPGTKASLEAEAGMEDGAALSLDPGAQAGRWR
jgi:hypothetical protein